MYSLAVLRARDALRILLTATTAQPHRRESPDRASPTRTWGPIDLLMTDVVMKTMNGPQTAPRFRALRPRARVLLISGYSGNELQRQGVDSEPFLERPFSMDEMAIKVRETPDR